MKFPERVVCYCKEQLEPVSRFFLSIIVTAFIYLMISIQHKMLILSWEVLVPAFSTFLLLIYYRISDEFKDYETDKKYFPDRPIPSGRVHLLDLKILLLVVTALSIGINLVYSGALKDFLYALIFTALMGKWFFMEKFISSNRLIAFFTHAPVGFFLYYYMEKYILNLYGLEWSFIYCLNVIGFIVFPGLVWEILRKTYWPEDEMPGYQIYSTMLGFTGSLAFGAFWVILTIINNYYMIEHFPFLGPLRFPLLGLNILLLLGILFQSLRPWIRNLKRVTEVYMALHLLLPLSYLIMLARRF